MKIDLRELKDNVQQEMLQLEQRRQTLEAQMDHIEAVQRLVSGLDSVPQSVDATLLAGPVNGRKKHWFRG